MSLITKLNPLTTFLLAGGLLVTSASWRVAIAQPRAKTALLSEETFHSIHQQISPQTGESRWMAIPWLTDLNAARQKAAAEGKPLFLMVSGKGLSIGMC